MAKISYSFLLERLQAKFGDKILSSEEPYGMLTITADQSINIEILDFLYKEVDLQYQFLTDICGIHYPDNELQCRAGTDSRYRADEYRCDPVLAGTRCGARRSRAAILEPALLLALGEDAPGQRARPTALTYLTVLRHCLDRLPPDDGEAIQFAIVQTRGRSDTGARPITLRFLSAWHSA